MSRQLDELREATGPQTGFLFMAHETELKFANNLAHYEAAGGRFDLIMSPVNETELLIRLRELSESLKPLRGRALSRNPSYAI